jgi:hypothetical protein
MTHFLLIPLGCAKARTNDDTGGDEKELDKSPFPG